MRKTKNRQEKGILEYMNEKRPENGTSTYVKNEAEKIAAKKVWGTNKDENRTPTTYFSDDYSLYVGFPIPISSVSLISW